MGRRAHGDGTVHKREDGRWSVLLSGGIGQDGKRSRRSTTCKTQKEARETLKRWIAERDAGLDTSRTAQDLTVGALMEEFLGFCRERGLRPKTIENYEHLSRLHIVPALGAIEVRALDAWTITRFLATRDKLEDKGTRVGTAKLSPRSARQIRMVLRRALEIARKKRVIAANPADEAEAPPLDHYEAKSLTVEEAAKLLGALDGHQFGAFYAVMLGLGMRPGEIRGLRWEDIEFGAGNGTGWVRVCRQVQRVDGAYRELPVKTKKGNRRIALPGFVARALSSHRELLRAEIAAAEAAGMTRPLSWAGLVFQNGDGNPVEERHVVRRFHELTDRLGVPRVRLYDLRRTCVTFLHAAGVPVGVIKDIVGHSQISVTMDYYTDTHDPSRDAAARMMDATLGTRRTEFGG